MAYTAILLTLLLMFIVYKLLQLFAEKYFSKHPPGPNWWLRNKETMSKNGHLVFWNHKELYGPISRASLLHTEVYIVNTIDAIRELLLTPDLAKDSSSRDDSFLTLQIMQNGVAMETYGEKWRMKRTLVTNLFKPYASKAIEKVVTKELFELKKELNKFIGTAIDIKDYFGRSLANIMFIMMIGKRFDYDHEIQSNMAKWMDLFKDLTDAKCLVTLSLFPFLRFSPFGFGALYRDWQKYQGIVMKYVYHDIRAQGREAWENNEGLVYDLLVKQQENDWITDDDVVGIIRDLFLGGILTTKPTLYAMFLYMLHNPSVQTKLHKELDDLDDEPCLDYHDTMPYAQAVVLETLRMASTVPMTLPHLITDHMKFRGYDLLKGSIILPNIWKIHHDETFWADPWKFNADRFIDDEGKLVLIDDPIRRHLIPFGLGKRRCLGENFARTRMFLFVTHLCKAFRFYSDDPDSLPKEDPRCHELVGFITVQNYKLKIELRK